MEARFFNYNALITFIGTLDKDSFQEALIEALGEGPKFIPRISSGVTLLEYSQYRMIKIDLIYFIKKGILTEEDKIRSITDLKQTIRDAIEKELKAQKLMFNFEND